MQIVPRVPRVPRAHRGLLGVTRLMHRTRIAVFAFAVALVAGWLLLHTKAATGESNGTPAAKALFAEGDAAARAGKLADAAAAFQKAIDADPDFVDAHQRFIEVTQRLESAPSRTPSVARLHELYERLASETRSGRSTSGRLGS